MDRRRFIRTAGLTAGTISAAGFLAACGEGMGLGSDTANGPAVDLDTSAADLAVINASFETLTGTGRRMAFGLTGIDRSPVRDAEDVEVHLRNLDGEVLSGPYPTRFFPEAGGGLGIYLAHINVPDPGPIEAVVTTGDRIGATTINVIDPTDSRVVVPGEPAIAVATATTADPGGLEELCTQRPEDCGMHEASLDQLLDEGRPVLLLFATPAYCQTAVCAPAVTEVDALRTSRDFSDLAFVHVEIFSDAGQTLSEPVRVWELPTEPWLFLIDRDGTVAARLEGALIPDEVDEVIQETFSL